MTLHALLRPRDSSLSPWVACLHLAQLHQFLKAAADAVRERWWTQGATLGDEQAGRCNWRTGGGSNCPPRQAMLDRLTLLLCSLEMLGHVTGCVAEEASLGYRNLEEPNLLVSLCQADTARGGAPGPQVWTSHDPETVP